jgi:hypothetical protein
MHVEGSRSRRFATIIGALVAGALVGGTAVYLAVTATRSSPVLYRVVFQQMPHQLDHYNVSDIDIPWSVTIGGVTEVQPPSTSLPLNGSGRGTQDMNLSKIVFSLADGTYGFVVSNLSAPFNPPAGSVVVNGSDVLVRVYFEPP